MPPLDEFDGTGSISIDLNFDVGRTSVRMAKFQLSGGDSMAQTAVIDRVIKQILAGWPRTAYAGEIRRLVRVALCESART
jgi:hypothetical protein